MRGFIILFFFFSFLQSQSQINLLYNWQDTTLVGSTWYDNHLGCRGNNGCCVPSVVENAVNQSVQQSSYFFQNVTTIGNYEITGTEICDQGSGIPCQSWVLGYCGDTLVGDEKHIGMEDDIIIFPGDVEHCHKPQF